MEVKLTIQEKLFDLRKDRHLTLEDLAAYTGLSSSALGSCILKKSKLLKSPLSKRGKTGTKKRKR